MVARPENPGAPARVFGGVPDARRDVGRNAPGIDDKTSGERDGTACPIAQSSRFDHPDDSGEFERFALVVAARRIEVIISADTFDRLPGIAWEKPVERFEDADRINLARRCVPPRGWDKHISAASRNIWCTLCVSKRRALS